jgi:hypothetical protein
LGEEVFYHLPRDILRIGGDAFSHNAVIGREHEDGGFADADLTGVLYQTYLFRQRFQYAQTAERLGLVINSAIELCCERLVAGGMYGRCQHYGFCKFDEAGILPLSGRG